LGVGQQSSFANTPIRYHARNTSTIAIADVNRDGTLGFARHGKANDQTRGGVKVQGSEREETWGQVVELASAAALKNAFQQLDAAPKPKQSGSAFPPAPAE
jgi:hypothetical protein